MSVNWSLRNRCAGVWAVDSSWKLIKCAKDDLKGAVNRRLGEDGGLIFEPAWERPVSAVNRLARPSEYIFASARRSGRKQFKCMDGSQLLRPGCDLYRYSGEGEFLRRYGAPWYLLIFTFPWPAALALVLFFLFAYIGQ